jgi:subtilisin family serine protease
MNKVLLAASAIATIVAIAPAHAQRPGDKIAGSYICVFNDSVGRGAVNDQANNAARSAGGQVTHVYTHAIRGFAANLPDAAVANMRANNPSIAYCEQDQVMSIPPVRATGAPSGGFTAQAQETPWGIARVGYASGVGKTAWVIDTGIQPDHPDLVVDTARSRTFLGRNSTPWDQNGHGTHVAGTIAAKDDANGVVGVAAGASVVAVRVLDRRGSGTTSGVIAGVDYVASAGKPGEVANMSLGGGVSSSLDTAVLNASNKGIWFALAAGNESDHANNHSPARVNGTYVRTVSAFAIGDKWASYSNYGNPPIDYAEPGSSIKSTWLNGGYHTISGTSMATPHLAGLLLLNSVRNGGNVSGDPDGNPDVIGVK